MNKCTSGSKICNSAQSEETSRNGVVVSGLTYRDIILTGLTALPRDGEEVYATHLFETWGGIATMARVLARLEMTTYLSTAIGDDDASGRFLKDMVTEGIDTSFTARHDAWPFPTTVALSTHQDRAMATCEIAPPLPLGHLISEAPLDTRAIIADLRDAPNAWAAAARERGAKVYASRGFDPTGEWGPAQLPGLSQCDVWMLNDLEAKAFARTSDPLAAAQILSELVPTVIVTRGKDGMVGVDRTSGEEGSVGAFPSSAKNKTGAGDSTLAAFAFADRPEISLKDRMLTAAFIVGAILDREAGAADPLTLRELRSLCAQRNDDSRTHSVAGVLG